MEIPIKQQMIKSTQYVSSVEEMKNFVTQMKHLSVLYQDSGMIKDNVCF